jgi:hypothetical protein
MFFVQGKLNVSLLFDPGTAKSIVVVALSDFPMHNIACQLMENQKHFSIPAVSEKKPDLNKFVGDYTVKGEEVINIIRKEGSLQLFFNAEENHRCYFFGGNTFFLSARHSWIVFEEDQEKNIIGFRFENYSPHLYRRL